MLAALVIALPILATAAFTARAHAASSSVALTEKGSSGLVFLAKHPAAGNNRSRSYLRHLSKRRVWNGLRMSGTLSGLLCIHGYEGPWHHDTNPKYDGGLQADRQFQYAYGRPFVWLWGSADRWPVWAQLVMGYRAVRVRGFSPWPTTSRLCGL